MIYKAWFCIRHLPSIIKFYITNWRFNKFGYRRFRFILSEEIPKEKGGGFKYSAPIIIKAGRENITHPGKLIEINADPIRVAHFKLRDEHTEVFTKHDSYRYKEII